MKANRFLRSRQTRCPPISWPKNPACLRRKCPKARRLRLVKSLPLSTVQNSGHNKTRQISLRKKRRRLSKGKKSSNLRKKSSRRSLQAGKLNVARRSHQLRRQRFRQQFVALWKKRSSNRRRFTAPARADV